jgi:hypothetical protein
VVSWIEESGEKMEASHHLQAAPRRELHLASLEIAAAFW